MAEQAQKEPTMEEILASIRKIISEDDEAPSASRADSEEVSFRPEDVEMHEQADGVAENELTLEDLPAGKSGSDMDIFDEVELSMTDDVAPKPAFGRDRPEFDAPVREAASEDLPTPPSFENLATRATEPDETFVSKPFEPEPVDLEEANFQASADLVRPVHEEEVPATPAQEETVMHRETESRVDRSALTEDVTADAAASALSRLASRMEVGSENTLEGLVRELIKPMIKTWLDDNLPRIVEEKVEIEVQRIARLAR